jgi:hypothetical protein
MARFNDVSTSAFVAVMLVVAAASHGLSQAGQATIRGTVTDPEGSVFAGAFVTVSGGPKAMFDTATGADGKYSLQVPAGTYELSVMLPGMKPFRRTGLVLETGQSIVADVRLEDGPSLRTLGEDPASLIARFLNRPDPPKGPTPRLRDRTPDLSGMWLSGPASFDTLEMLPWASALAKERTENHAKDYPPTYCLPSEPAPLLGPGFFQLVQHQKVLLMLFESDTPGFRQVYLDGRPHPKTAESLWLGHSIGRWEKETLVIDTVGFKDRGWLGFEGHPHTDKLRVTQRLRRPDLGHLEIEIAIDDPGALQKPWKTMKTATLAPDEEVREYICNENNKAPLHIVGK